MHTESPLVPLATCILLTCNLANCTANWKWLPQSSAEISDMGVRFVKINKIHTHLHTAALTCPYQGKQPGPYASCGHGVVGGVEAAWHTAVSQEFCKLIPELLPPDLPWLWYVAAITHSERNDLVPIQRDQFASQSTAGLNLQSQNP